MTLVEAHVASANGFQVITRHLLCKQTKLQASWYDGQTDATIVKDMLCRRDCAALCTGLLLVRMHIAVHMNIMPHASVQSL